MTLKEMFFLGKRDKGVILGIGVAVMALVVLLIPDSESPKGNGKGIAERKEKKDTLHYATEEKVVRLTAFDPNTADSTLLLQLGLQPWQVRSIYKFRAHGGVYTCPEDFARLYGLSVKKYRELLPYIRIAEEYRPAAELYARHEGRYASSRYRNAHEDNGIQKEGGTVSSKEGEMGKGLDRSRQRILTDSDSIAARRIAEEYIRKLKPGETVPLNHADTTTLRSVPGIGRYFARRIVQYRGQLGGFVSKEQLLEIEDFPSSSLPFFSLHEEDIRSVKKININKASVEQMRRHPYISPYMARQIREYRQIRGKISDLSDLRLLPTFPQKTIERLYPYIEY